MIDKKLLLQDKVKYITVKVILHQNQYYMAILAVNSYTYFSGCMPFTVKLFIDKTLWS